MICPSRWNSVSCSVSDKRTKKYLAGDHYCCAGPTKAALPLSLVGELSHDWKSLSYLEMLFLHKLPQLPLLEVYNQSVSINGIQFSCEAAGVHLFVLFTWRLTLAYKKWRYWIIFLFLLPAVLYTDECYSLCSKANLLLLVLVLLLLLYYYFHCYSW